MRVGMMGAGNMALKMTKTFQQMENIETVALASKSGKGKVFVDKLGWKRCYTSYEELLEDKEIDIVYIPTPTQFHPELCRMAIDYGKPILCEKPLCINEKLSREILDYAHEKKVFLAEGLWTNYMPVRKMIDDVLESGVLGELQDVEIVMKNNVVSEDRFQKFELGAGAVMDIGSYSIGASMFYHLGPNVHYVSGEFEYLENGLDKEDKLLLEYDSGLQIKIYNNIASDVYEKYCWFNGTKARLFVDGTSNPKGIRIEDLNGNVLKDEPVPKQISGFEYQWQACEKALAQGKLEPDEVPHDSIIRFMLLMDEIRSNMGLKFPFE